MDETTTNEKKVFEMSECEIINLYGRRFVVTPEGKFDFSAFQVHRDREYEVTHWTAKILNSDASGHIEVVILND